MNMIRISYSIGGVEVRPGALIARPLTTDRLFGRSIKPGARCESLEPETWTAVVCADARLIWEGKSHSSYDSADAEARAHAQKRIDNHLREIFQ